MGVGGVAIPSFIVSRPAGGTTSNANNTSEYRETNSANFAHK